MTKAEKRAQLDCQMAGCKHYYQCRIYWGRRCTHQGGRKVPRLRMRVYNDIDLVGYADVVTLR